MAEHPSPSFLGACGAGTPLRLTVQRGGDPALGHVLHQPFVLLREDAHPVSPGGGGLSPRVYLQLVGGRVFCLSLGEGRIPPGDGAMLRCGWLGPGQTLRVGGAAVQLTRTDAEESPPPVWAAGDWNPLTSSSLRRCTLPGVALELVNRASRKRPRPIKQMLTLVGGAGGCSLRLVSRSVARFHCALLLTPAGLWAVDLRGTDGNPEWQGITINGTRAAWGHLADNDEILVGRFLYRVRYNQVHPEGVPTPSETRSLAVWDQPSAEGELVPSGTGPRGVPGGAGRVSEQVLFAQALLGPILNQFGLMQRQMLSELEQTLAMVVDRVEALHREQARRLEAEASRLGQGLSALQTEVAKLQGASQAPQPPALPAPAAPRPGGTSPGRRTPQPQAVPPAPLKNTEVAGGATAVDVVGPARAPAPGVPSGPDLDTWLYDRLQEFHQEQRNLWQKVLHRVLGK